MRSLHVVTNDARRGAETFAVDLALQLEDVGHQAQVVALTRSSSGKVHSVPCLGPSRRSPATLRHLRRLAGGVDVVVAHGSSTLEACTVGLAASGTPFIYRSIGDLSYWQTSEWRRRLAGVSLRRAARVVTLWQGAADHVVERHRIPRDLIDVIPNAVRDERFAYASEAVRQDARRRLGIPADAACLAYVGALSPEKNIGSILQAVGRLPEAVLLIAGDGLERPQLEQQAVALLSKKRVRILGPVDNPSSVYAAADLLLLPSHSEGMPAVLIEAALVGTPTVATAVGSVPEMIEEGVTGFLTAGSDPSTLLESIQSALPSAREVGVRASKAFRGRYSIEKIAAMWAVSLRRALQA